MDEKHLTDRAKKDLTLVAQAIAGDQRAFAQLMADYRDSIYFMMFKMVNNRDDAEDLTIEAFAKAFRNLEQYKADYAFSTWLFKIASNNSIDFMRRRRRLRTISLEEGFTNSDGESQSIDVQSEQLNPEEDLMKGQRKDELQRIVTQLKPRYRLLVELRYFQELSYEEVAEHLDLPLGTVKAQLFRARELLLEILRHSKNSI